jgi:tellurite resistance protein
LIEGNCPNCGARVEINQSAICDHCKAILRSGDFDWVLTEITQESEWRPQRRHDVPGMLEMRTADPAFSRAELEDRSAVIYWRKAMAGRIGKIDPLRKFALDDICRRYEAALSTLPDGTRRYFGDCAVGSVDLLGVIVGEAENQAIVQVVWEGEMTVVAPGRAPEPSGNRSQAHTLFVLKRNAGVLSDASKGVSSAHCPGCGSPMTSDLSPSCSHCGRVLNDVSNGWVLSDILMTGSPEGAQLIAQLAPLRAATRSYGTVGASAEQISGVRPMPSPAGMLAWAVKMAVADGSVDPRERRLLESLAAKGGIDSARVNQMIAMALAGGLDVPDPEDKPSARIWLGAIASIAMADGTLQPAEMELLSAAAQRFGFSSEDITLILRQQQAALIAKARDSLRG